MTHVRRCEAVRDLDDEPRAHVDTHRSGVWPAVRPRPATTPPAADPARDVVGATGGLRDALDAARRAARSDATVLVRGETGTGKELIARVVHEASPRARAPFVKVNCAALPDGVLQSELFGHEQGAFTGATRARRGRFELAHGGTIFLDEIGDISPLTQVSLLRVLQEREIERVGGCEPLAVNVRVVAATHQDLEALVAAGRFRADLYFRLNVVPIRLPPLRERPHDVAALLDHFVRKHAGGRAVTVAPEVYPALARHRFPGNVRELENLVQRALVLARGATLALEDFALEPTPAAGRASSVRAELDAQAAAQIREALRAAQGNCARAARRLGVPRTTLASRARRLGLL